MITLSQIRMDIEGSSEDARFAAWMELYTSDKELAKQELKRVVIEKDPILKILFCKFLAHNHEEKAILYLQEMLLDQNEIVLENAIKAFDKNTYVDKIIKLLPVLQAPTTRAKYFAIDRLSTTKTIQATEPILEMLKNADEELMVNILTGLRFLTDRRILFSVKPLLDHPKDKIRFGAIMAIGSLYTSGYFHARQILLDCLTDPMPKNRQAIIWNLRNTPYNKDLKHFFHYSTHDPDPFVRQECLLGLSAFSNQKVIHHLIKVLITEKNKMVVLKGEAVLLSMPTSILVKELKKLLNSLDQKIKNKVMVLFAQFQKGSDEFFEYLQENLNNTKSEKEKVAIIHSLGLLENKKAISLLEQQLKASPIISYTSMAALLKVWGYSKEFPVLKYLKNDRLSDLTKQIVLKHFVKIGSKEMYSAELTYLFIDLLKSKNINIRYHSIQALVKVINPSVLVPIFKVIIEETDPTALKTAKDNIILLIQKMPQLLIGLMEKFKNSEKEFDELISMLSISELPKSKLLQILPMFLEAPLFLLQSKQSQKIIDFLFSYIHNRVITYDDILNKIEQKTTRQDLIAMSAEKLRAEPSLKIALPLQKLHSWIQEENLVHKINLVDLISHSDSNKINSILAAIICNESSVELQNKAATALNNIIWEQND